MTILALEFSSPQRSVAVVGSGARPFPAGVGEAIEAGPAAVGPLALVERALLAAEVQREQIEVLAIGLGPGSYTGIRAAISLAQGWQLARDTKLLGISSAECLAAQAQAEGIRGAVHVVIDAQRDEFYLARYEIGEDHCQETIPLRLAPLAEVRDLDRRGEALIGPEVTRWFPAGRTVFPRASALGKLALTRDQFVAGEKLEPVYLREAKFVKAPPPRVM